MCSHGFLVTPGTKTGIFTCCATYTCQLGDDGCLLTSAILFLLIPMMGEVSRSCSSEGCSDYSYGSDGLRGKVSMPILPSATAFFTSQNYIFVPEISLHDESLQLLFSHLVSNKYKIPTSLSQAHGRNTLPHLSKALGV